MTTRRQSVFVDESIRENDGFVLTAFVVSPIDLSPLVADALSQAGLTVGRDEFKSRTLMQNRPELRRLREQLFAAATEHAQLGFLVASMTNRSTLGRQILSALALLIRRNGFDLDELAIYLDQGLVRSRRDALEHVAEGDAVARSDMFVEQDSRRVLGLQVADAVAHAAAQLLSEGLKESPKLVKPGEAAGLAETDSVTLSWDLLLTLRNGVLTRPLVYQATDGTLRYATSSKFDRRMPPSVEMSPRIVGDHEDVAGLAQHAEVLGWGLFLSDDLTEQIRCAAELTLGRIWLGCMH